jgi:hypothetical protein
LKKKGNKNNEKHNQKHNQKQISFNAYHRYDDITRLLRLLYQKRSS